MSDDSKVNTAATNGNEIGVVEMKDATIITKKENAADREAETDIENITELVAAAGFETKIENYESKLCQRRHYSEVDEESDVTTNENAADAEGEADQETELVAAAGIETKIENYENIRTQRRHFSEAGDDDEVNDNSTEENAADVKGAVEIVEDNTETEEAARVEMKIIEDFEGSRTQRKHFPGSTRSNIFS